MTLAELARLCEATCRGAGDAVTTGITHRAQAIEPGWVFAALPGQRHHGMEFVREAIERGAVGVLSDRDPGAGVEWLASAQPRRAASLAAWALAGYPHRHLRVIGVTGTNGKSTVTDLIGVIARTTGEQVGVFGTVAHTMPHRTEVARRTTPEATDLATLFKELSDAGGTTAVMEVSSHALRLDRVTGLEFDVAVWTNLTRDHLDFHTDLEDYFAAKASLATLLRAHPAGRRVIGADDPFMARLLTQPRSGDLTFGLDRARDVTASDTALELGRTRFRLRTPAGDRDVDMPLTGVHNLRNALAAAAAAVAAGWPLDAIAAGLGSARPLAGRLEPVDAGSPFPVFVDYAHTPDALEQMLRSIRGLSNRRLIVVFGCGGDKDRGKRGPMGEIVGRLADVPIVTSDNPRSEDPAAIIESVMVGVRSAGNPRALAIADRREAIAAALAVADAGSIVIVAGKGHETEQIFADRTVAFDDRAVVKELARRRRP